MQNNLQLGSIITEKIVENEFHSLLKHFQGNSSINIANGIYVNQNYGIKSVFANIAKQKFYTTIRNLNFSNEFDSLNEINDVVNLKTNGGISSVISPKDLNDTSSIIITSAVYFNGPWLYQFENLNPQSLSIFFPSGCSFSSPSDIQHINMMHITVYAHICFGMKSYKM